MASTNKCEYCGSTITSRDQSCPNCGAANPLYVVDLPRKVTDPKTIEELQEYCAERGMPLLRMRFFIGQDFREPKAFGIYRDGSEFVVYKNKSDGSRSERYRGPDEAYAVRQLYDKLIVECHNRGIYPDGKPTRYQPDNGNRYYGSRYTGSGSSGGNGRNGSNGRNGRNGGSMRTVIIIIAVVIILFLLSQTFNSGPSGYYSPGGYSGYSNYGGSYGDGYGDSYGNSYNDYGGYSYDYDDYYDNGSSYSYDYDDDDDRFSSWDSDWDSDWSDWDSGDTDWDSDW